MTNNTNTKYIYIFICMQNHNDDTIETSDTVLRKIYLSLYLKGLLKTEQNCNILTPPTLMAISISFLFSCAVQPGAWGPASLGAGFLYRILSSTRLVSKLINRRSEGSLCWVLASSTASFLQLVWSPNSLIGVLRAHSAGCWLSLSHIFSNWSDLQTNGLPFLTELYNSSTPTFFLWASQFCTHSTCPRL